MTWWLGEVARCSDAVGLERMGLVLGHGWVVKGSWNPGRFWSGRAQSAVEVRWQGQGMVSVQQSML